MNRVDPRIARRIDRLAEERSECALCPKPIIAGQATLMVNSKPAHRACVLSRSMQNGQLPETR